MNSLSDIFELFVGFSLIGAVWIAVVFLTPIADNTFYKQVSVTQNVELEDCYAKRESFSPESRIELLEPGPCSVTKYEYGFPFKSDVIYQLPDKPAPTGGGVYVRAYTAQTGQYFFGMIANDILILFVPIILLLGLRNFYESLN